MAIANMGRMVSLFNQINTYAERKSNGKDVYTELAAAIIFQACADYYETLKDYMKYQTSYKKRKFVDIRSWFYTDWFETLNLNNIDKDVLMRSIELRVTNDIANNVEYNTMKYCMYNIK